MPQRSAAGARVRLWLFTDWLKIFHYFTSLANGPTVHRLGVCSGYREWWSLLSAVGVWLFVLGWRWRGLRVILGLPSPSPLCPHPHL